jgi:hypothetical protein
MKVGNTFAFPAVTKASNLLFGQQSLTNVKGIWGQDAGGLGGPLGIYIQARQRIRFHCVGRLACVLKIGRKLQVK